MILRRLADAFRRQDWATVFIEFLIVVSGIFVGLQVNNWNEGRLERGQERIALERLLEEAENAVAYLSDFIDDRAEANRLREAAIAYLTDPETYPMDEAEAADGLLIMTHYQAMAPARTVYDELSSSGKLQLIKSRKVRDAVSLYYAQSTRHDSHLDFFRQGADDVIDAALPYLSSEYDPDPENMFRRRNFVDWDAMREDDEAVFLALDSLRNQLVFQFVRKSVLEHAQIMCDALAEELNRECRPQKAADRNEETP